MKNKRCSIPLSVFQTKKSNSDVFITRGKTRTACQIICSHPFCKYLIVGFCSSTCYTRFHDLLKSKDKAELELFFKNDVCIHVQKASGIRRTNILKPPQNWLVNLVEYEKTYKTFFDVAALMSPTKTRRKRKSKNITNHKPKRIKKKPVKVLDLREKNVEK